MTAEEIELSIIVPVKDEEEAIAPFVVRVTAILDGLFAAPGAWEILFIDDGSSDATLARIRAAHAADRRVRGLSLSRNFGKEAALSAGIDDARGKAVIPIDVDLQDPPELIGPMVEKWREGFDVVYGVRTDRKTDTLSKRLTAHLYYSAHNALSTEKIPAHAGDFRLLDRSVIESIRQLPERTRVMKSLFAWAGFRQTALEYRRVPREVGQTKFRYWKLWTLALDGITSSTTVPLRMWSYIGGGVATMALLYALVMIVRTLVYGIDVPGYTSLLVAILFLGGMQLFSLGVLGEYVGRIFIEVKRRPLYIVREVIGGSGGERPAKRGGG